MSIRKRFLYLKSFFFLPFLALVCMPGTSFAAQPSPDALRGLNRLQEQQQQQQEERRRSQEDALRRRGEGPPSLPGTQPLPQLPEESGAPCMEVRTIEVTGCTIYSERKIRDIVVGYEGKCLTLADINNLLRKITNLYLEDGYVTSRAFADTTQEEPGVLKIVVIEGKVEDIIFNDGDRNMYYRGYMSFPAIKGKVLNLRDIEQGLDQMNRLRSGNASMELLPGDSLGGTIVMVRDDPLKTWWAGLGLDNLGQRSTGQYQYAASIEKDNFFGLGDQVAFFWTQDAPFLDSGMHKGRQQGHNHSAAGYFSLPIGYWTLSADISAYSYDTRIPGELQDFTFKGTSNTMHAAIERVIHRDAESKTSLGLSITNRNVDNSIEGYHLDVSSYDLTTLTGSITHSRRVFGGVLGGGFDYSQGVGLKAKREADYDHDTPSTRYKKYGANISWYRPFALFEEQFSWSLFAAGQISPDTLFGAERVQIGGYGTVRGFHEDSFSGDQGGYVRNEVACHCQVPGVLAEKGILSAVQVFAAYDAGYVHRDRRNPYERGRAQGIAAGIRTRGDCSFELTFAKAVAKPSFVKTRDSEVYASVRWTF